ncbi:uncharacterized protein BP5553_02761 [Venustampulla echinocandica]|uniref:Uncharacterized protein n=1 Tax=Venustampulla echinocandica TaxID=2656787 RepID=A0A370TSB7_9HELO|nr:uncharacterized protein BP5553_02761 [Venustampulla echinocandica]RDL38421.1 hypothetical protein BP5553_02761 [Venustampulla echinocandica]
MSTMECLRSFDSSQLPSAPPLDVVANKSSATTKQSQPSWIANLRHKASIGLRGYDYHLCRAENAVPSEKTSDDTISITYNSNSIFAPANHHPELLTSISPKQIGIDARVLRNADFRKSSSLSNATSVDNPFSDEPSVTPPEMLKLETDTQQAHDPLADCHPTPDSFKVVDDPIPDPLTAAQQYRTQQGSFWESVKRVLATSFLHPANLTETEFVSLVCTHGEQKPAWFEKNRLRVAHRAVNQWVTAHKTLINAGIPPRELRGRLLDAFEWMDKTEQNMFIHSYKLLQRHILMDAASLNLTYAEQEKFLSLALPGKYDFVKAYRVNQMNELWNTTKSTRRRPVKPKFKGVRRAKAKPLRVRKPRPDELRNRTSPSQSCDEANNDQPHNTSSEHGSREVSVSAPGTGEALTSLSTIAVDNDVSLQGSKVDSGIENVPPRRHTISRQALGDVSEVPYKAPTPREKSGKARKDGRIVDDKITANPFEIGEYNPAGPRMCRTDSAVCLERSHPRRNSVSATTFYCQGADGNYDARTLKKSLTTITSKASATTSKSILKNSPSADPDISEEDAKGFRIEFVERRSVSSKASESTPPAPSCEPASVESESRNDSGGTKCLRKKISTFFGTLARREKVVAKDTDA